MGHIHVPILVVFRRVLQLIGVHCQCKLQLNERMNCEPGSTPF